MGNYDRNDITHIFDDAVNYYIPKENYFGFDIMALSCPNKYYKKDMTDAEKELVKEFVRGLKKKCKPDNQWSEPILIISERRYWRYLKEFSGDL